MGLFSSSKTQNTTNLDVDDYSNQVASYGNLDARGGQIIEIAGVSGAVNLSLSDHGAIDKAFQFGGRALDSMAGIAELATDQANIADDSLDSFVIFGGLALLAVGVIFYAGS